MRFVVTGAAGFIGSNIVKGLNARGIDDIIAVDDLTEGDKFRNLADLRIADYVDADLFYDAFADGHFGHVEAVFHEGACSDTMEQDGKYMMDNNYGVSCSLFESCQQRGTRLLYASSAAVYGGSASFRETPQFEHPLNVYGYSKLTMEHLAERYAPKLKHPIVGLRYFNVYGPGEQHKGKFASMIHQLAKQMRAGNRPRIFKNGEQKRDFVYIDDVIAANVAAMTSKQSGVFNVGSGAAGSFNDVVAQLNRVLKTDLPPDYIDNPYDFFQTHTEADLTQSRAVLGYNPQYDLRKGVDAYVASGTLGM